MSDALYEKALRTEQRRQRSLESDDRMKDALATLTKSESLVRWKDLAPLIAGLNECDQSLDDAVKGMQDYLIDELLKLRKEIEGLRGGSLKWAGVWRKGASYEAGDVTQYAGSTWRAERATSARPSGDGGQQGLADWKLVTKAGRDLRKCKTCQATWRETHGPDCSTEPTED